MMKVYTKDNCPACIALKGKLFKDGVPFQEVHIGRDITREEFLAKFPTARTVPYIEDDDK
jgi:glutaredoxin